MLFSRSQLYGRLAACGVPTLGVTVQGNIFASVSREWVREIWIAGLASLERNAPGLVDVRQLGGGKSQLVPRYLLNGFNCRGHSLYLYAHGMLGFALKAANAAAPLDHDALAFGFLYYTAEPRADTLGRAGRHEQLWFLDHAGEFQTFEGGDGEENEMTPTELASITFLFAQ